MPGCSGQGGGLVARAPELSASTTRTLRNLIESHSETAATLLYNPSVTLCALLQKTNQRL